MTSRPARKIRESLMKKGFAEDRSRDHAYYWLVVDGKETGIKTKISHAETECRDTLLGFMAKQVQLSRKDFLNLVDCSLGKETYHELLRQTGKV